MSKEQFNPYDPKYKRVEDLPEEEQGKFADVEGGFVKKEAAELYTAAVNKVETDAIAAMEEVLAKKHETAIEAIQGEATDRAEFVAKTLKVINLGKWKLEDHPELMDDVDILVAVTKRDRIGKSSVLSLASPELQHDRSAVLRIVSAGGRNLEYASEELKNDKEVVLAAVNNEPSALEYASEELKNDKEVVLAALSLSPLHTYMYPGAMLKFASENLRNNPDVVLNALGGGFRYASDVLRDDPKIVEAAVNSSGLNLEYASERFRGDREFVRRTIEKDAFAIRYASEELRNDPEIMRFAIDVAAKEGYSGVDSVLKYASEELRNNPEFVMYAAEKNKRALHHASPQLLDSAEFMLRAMQLDSKILAYASDRLKKILGVKERD